MSLLYFTHKFRIFMHIYYSNIPFSRYFCRCLYVSYNPFNLFLFVGGQIQEIQALGFAPLMLISNLIVNVFKKRYELMVAGVRRFDLRDWSLITRRGGGLQNWKIPTHSRQGETFCTAPLLKDGNFLRPPSVCLKLQASELKQLQSFLCPPPPLTSAWLKLFPPPPFCRGKTSPPPHPSHFLLEGGLKPMFHQNANPFAWGLRVGIRTQREAPNVSRCRYQHVRI